ncbi:hypothetical protein KPP03845_100920 [Streptomyces xanthophaeus]|nr:hypothetical protein KPP03845_100920 [Streptomyces xanthophaeus]
MTADPADVSPDGTGNSRITPRRDASGTWTSGRIETRRADFQPPAGAVLRTEARIRMPDVTGAAAKGYWPAFWTLGAPHRGNWRNWPGVGELDSAVQAEAPDDQAGTVQENTTDTGGGRHLASLADGDWALHRDVDSAPARPPGSAADAWRAGPRAGPADSSRSASAAGPARRSAASPQRTPGAGRTGARCPRTSRESRAGTTST